ncbi:MAG: restriction endonuclease [Acetobacteraceae bacterium]|nr:restriction endonuclease [Acetobacteraceae bacterium]
MPRHELKHAVGPDGFEFRLVKARSLLGGGGDVPPAAWADDMHPGLPLLRQMAEAGAASRSAAGVLVPHARIASLAPAEATALGLPPPCPHALVLESRGAFSDEDFAIRLRWVTQGGADVAGLRRTGALLKTVVDRFTLRDPLYLLVEEVERLNALPPAAGPDRTDRLDARMAQLARVKRALTDATGDAAADRYLAQLTISHATGLGVDLDGPEDDPRFRPTLFGDVPPPPGAADNEDVDTERQPLLPEEQARRFSGALFPRTGAWSHYRLDEGAYVVLDRPVVAALRVVKRVNASDRETRRKFRRDPSSFLLPEIEAAGGAGDVLCGGTVLIPEEAQGYGDRVLGIAEWEGKAFSFKIPVTTNWFPGEDGAAGEAVSSIEVPGADEPLVVRSGEIDRVIASVERAKAEGASTFTHAGRTYPLGGSDELLATLRALLGQVGPTDATTDTKPKGPEEEGKSRRRLVLRVAENEEDLSYLARLRDPDGALSRATGPDVPGLVSTPDPHQRDAIAWLQLCFVSGMPGVLLADDMGLGKTFEVLAFLHWLRQSGGTDGRPILIVAPSKLLDEWREQIGVHLPPMAFGRPVYAYDRGLKDITIERGDETELGRATLDIERLRGADWVLTTYETLRDHQFSFSLVRFRVAVFDEAQKIKSGTSMLNHAAKAQQPDFVVLMTGTPIENSTMDIWTLLDVAWPGFLGVSGKDFVARYGNGTDEALMMSLKDRLVSQTTWGEGPSARTMPPVMLRRFKAQILAGLPPKREERWDEPMPAAQARAYDAVLDDMRAGRLKALAALQALRQICLHPEMRMPRDAADRRALIDASARVRALFRVLRRAREDDQAVLVFVDIRKAQDALQAMIRDEFGLPRMPDIINGNTPVTAVSEIKARFQAGRGFGVLLLGPRSAGFGLTLTRATQVVHLNRWWNPAVEDQCSDRTHRKGQTRPVTVHLPIARHPRLGDESFDVLLDQLLTFKREQSRRVIVPSALTERELAELYSRMTFGSGSARGQALDELDRQDWRSFEIWVARRFQEVGWQVSETPRSGDGGVDVVCRHPANRSSILVQVKHKAMGLGQVTDDAVAQIRAAPLRYRGHPWLRDPLLLVATNGRFDLRARTAAQQGSVKLVDRDDILALGAIARDLLNATQPAGSM